VLLGLLFLVPAARAGGWAVVTLDELPGQVRQGESLLLGFTVRQHSRTPTNAVKPYLEARNLDDGKVVQIEARQEGPVGHFVLELSFPSAGSWEWSIIPAPFAGTPLPPLTVLPAVVQPAEATGVRAAAPQFGLARSIMRWAGLALLLGGAGVGAYRLRSARRPAAVHSWRAGAGEAAEHPADDGRPGAGAAVRAPRPGRPRGSAGLRRSRRGGASRGASRPGLGCQAGGFTGGNGRAAQRATRQGVR
jgi:hypothetical protein